MVRRLILFFWLFQLNNSLQAQSYEQIDSLTLQYYLAGDWEKLASLGDRADICGFRSNLLLQRFAYAELNLGRYLLAEKYVRCALKLSSADGFTQEILYRIKLAQGQIRQAIYLGHPLGYYKGGAALMEIGLESGVKIASGTSPGDFLHGGAKLGLRFGNRIFLDQFFAVNRQQYFWEDFSQFNFTSLPEILLDHRFSLIFPVQYASYSSNLAHSDSTYFPVIINYKGEVTHQAWQISGMFCYKERRLQLQGGGSYFIGKTQPVFDVTELYDGGNQFIQRFESMSNYRQFQLNVSTQLTFFVFSRKILAGLHAAYVAGDKDTGINVRPYIFGQLFKRLGLYGEYWHKGRYMVSSPYAGVLVNNVNTRSHRWLAMLSYTLNRRIRLEGTWFFEQGDDQLYLKDFKYNSLFLTFTFYI